MENTHRLVFVARVRVSGVGLLMAHSTLSVDVEALDPRTAEARRRGEWPPREHSTERECGPDWQHREAGREECRGEGEDVTASSARG